jgi:2-polyprenyl-6-methoxyphenol hydroxylase-like FAD-dependent oxidoreductase
MSARTGREVIIIGGGIGGLCAALALRQAGIEATVYEQAHELGEVGAGITLWANALTALKAIDLADAVRAVSAPGMRAEIRRWDGTLLSGISYRESERNDGAAYVAVHRADLQAILLTALGPDAVHLGARCIGFAQDHDAVQARFSDGREVHGAALIGADGIHSMVRAHLHGEHKPRYAGYTTWRGVAPVTPPLLPVGVMVETWGHGQRFGLTHIGGGRVYWFATRNTVAGEADAAGGRKAELLARFQGWHAPIEAVIASTESSAILRNDIYDRQPLRRWGEGRVTLLGDAAHPMTPNLGQGACQAIEDAVVLAACVRNGAPIATALRDYEAHRIARTTAVVRRSRLMGWYGQRERPFARWLRDTSMKHTPRVVQRKQLETVVRFSV